MSLYKVATSGLLAYQQALNVTGSNIENILTPGYSRRTVTFSERNYNGMSSGVDVSNTQRIYDEYVNSELRTNISSYQYSSVYYDFAANLDSLLSSDSTSINKSLQNFFESMQAMVSDPAAMTSRQVFLNQAQSLTTQFHGVSQQFTKQMDQINNELVSSAQQITDIAQNIAKLNTQIMSRPKQADSLMDQRDNLLCELAELVPVSTVENADGSIDVYLGSGDGLVIGGVSTQITTERNANNPQQMELVLKNGSASKVLSNELQGGRLGGLLSYRRDVLQPAMREFDRLALTIADSMNRQHQQGMDLQGNMGGLFFQDINATELSKNRVIADKSNVGVADMAVNISDVSQLKTSDYQLDFTDATTYSLTRISDGSVVASGSVGSLPATIDADGFTVEISSGSFAAGDSFVIAPTRDAAQTMQLAITDASHLALASPLRAVNGANNTGGGQVVINGVIDPDNPSFATPGTLAPPLKIEFLSATSYQIVDTNTAAVIEGPLTYDPATGSDVFPTSGGYDPGYRISLTGAMAAGDSFSIEYNQGGVTDNSNGIKLAELQTTRILDGGQATFQESYHQLSGTIASRTFNADIAQQAAAVMVNQSQDRRDAVSAVNLDEEIANLMFYQQAYQASAQLIAVADNLFGTLLDVL